MGDQTNSLLTNNMVVSSSNPSKRQALRIMLNESAIFNGVMVVICTSFTCLFLWMTLGGIYNPNPNPVFRRLITYFSALLACFFCFLALLACRNLVRKLDLQKFVLLSPKREGNKWPILKTIKAVTYAEISWYLVLNDSQCEAKLRSILGITSPTAMNMLIAKLLIFCASTFFCYLANLEFEGIVYKNSQDPKSDSEDLLSANEVAAAVA